MKRFVLGLSLAAGLAAAAPSTADACTPPLPDFGRTLPADSDPVPENFVLFFDGYEFSPFEAYWWDFDIRVPMQTETLGRLGLARFDPSQLGVVVPNPMQLELEHTGNMNILNHTVEVRVALEVRDEQPPAAPGPASLSFEYREAEPGLCEPGGYTVMLEFPSAIDDWAVSAYRLFESESEDGPTQPVATRLAPNLQEPTLRWSRNIGERTGRRCYHVVAYDIAGQPSLPSPTTCIDVGPRSDAGPPDAGVALDAAAASDAGDTFGGGLETDFEGCTCATPERPAGLGALLLLGGLLLRRRRHR